MIPIESADDPRITSYRNVQERDLVGRQGLFVAEGEVVLRVFAQSTLVEPLSLLIAENRIASLAPILASLAPNTPIYTASQSVMDSIVGFHIHRGILALGRRRDPPSADALLTNLPPECVVLALVGIANHDNMGGIFRNAAAFGVDAVIADASCCDPLYRKSIRVSVGGVFQVPFARLEEGTNLVELLRRHNLAPLALSPAGATTLSDLKVPSRSAVILGTEGAGLPDDILAQCTTIRIPMAQGFDSLNVATTSGIVLHHLGNGTSRFASP